MNRYERVAKALRGDPVDRLPVGAWGHFFTRELDARNFAAATIEFVERYDWDFLKVHPRACYHVEGWGFLYEASTDPGTDHRCTGHPIGSIDDWRKLKPIGLETPAFEEQFEAIRLLRSHFGQRLPIVMTVFSPLDVAEKLVDRYAALLGQHLDDDPEKLKPALAAITDTFVRFVRRLVALGVDGIYFSTQWASHSRLSPDTYRQLVRPFDLAVLAETRAMWCNILHLCGGGIHLLEMADYPVQAIHWDMHAPANPTLAEGKARIPLAVGGGVDVATLAHATAAQVEARLAAAVSKLASGALIGPGCSILMAATPPENFKALRRGGRPADPNPSEEGLSLASGGTSS